MACFDESYHIDMFITVLQCDNTAAMHLLMHYPWSTDNIASICDINDLIQLALQCRKPDVSKFVYRNDDVFLQLLHLQHHHMAESKVLKFNKF